MPSPPKSSRSAKRRAPPGESGTLKRPSNILILTLAPIRKHFEKEWQILGPQLDQLTERIVAQEMAGKGRHARYRNAFILQFHNTSERQRWVLAEAVASKLLQLMFAAKTFIPIKPSEMIQRDLPLATERKVKKPEARGLRVMFAKLLAPFRRARANWPQLNWVEHDEPEHAPSEPPPPTSSPSSQSPKNDKRPTAASRQSGSTAAKEAKSAGHGRASRRKPSAAAPASGAAPRQGRKDGGKRANAMNADDVIRLTREAKKIEANMVTAIEKRREDVVTNRRDSIFPPYDLEFVFRPAWNRENSILATYFCVPACTRDGVPCKGDAVLPKKPGVTDVRTLDVLTAQAGIEQFDILLKKKIRSILALPVHVSTLLDSESRLDYLDTLERISEPARRQLVFELIGLEEIAGETRAFDIFRRLSSHARGVLGRVTIHHSNFEFWKQLGLAAVGADLSDDDRREAEIMEDLHVFAGSAKRDKITSYVRGLRSVSLTTAAVGAGFVFIDSDVIDREPGNDGFDIVPYDLAEFYDGIAGRRIAQH